MSAYTHFKSELGEHGVFTVWMDVEGQAMNTLSTKVSSEMESILDEIESNAAIKSVVFASGKDASFIAGADIDMLSSVNSAQEASDLSVAGQKSCQRLENIYRHLGKPVVAAIDGPALGGGLEVALACSHRIISDNKKTVLGLPEVKLGLLPGSGGTQRLPQLVGIATSLDMMLTGRNIRGKKAIKMGLADELVPASIVVEVAQRRAAEFAANPPKKKTGLQRLKEMATEIGDPQALQQLALEENRVGRALLFKKAREAALSKTRGNYPAAEAILDVVREGADNGSEAGYAAEAKRFGELVQSAEADALMSIFHRMQALKKDSGVDDESVKAAEVNRVAVLGGGLMGGGVAAVSAIQAGTPVRIKEIDFKGAERGRSYVQKLLKKDVSRKRRSKHDAMRIMNTVTGCVDYTGFDSVELVIEAVFEDLELKRSILREVEENTPDFTIFASNTSSLPISDIAEGAKRPENVIGMHYFSPVEKMPFLEIITTPKTDDWVTATCVEYGKAQGKTVIVVNDGTGFYTSRILAPYMNEAAWALSEGIGIDTLDEAMMDWGFPVGPITLLDEVGIDVGAKVAKIMQAEFGDRIKAPGAMTSLIDDDRLGRKNGRGFYLYENGKKAGIDETVYQSLGITPSSKGVDIEKLQLRIGLQMVNEAALCLQEGILRSPRDGDIGAIFGLGFPPFTGGPFSYCDQVGVDKVVEHMKRFEQDYGARFTPAQVLVDAAKNKTLFSE